MTRRCLCTCHWSERADHRQAMHMTNWAAAMVLARKPGVNSPYAADVDDPLEAAVACDLCRFAHCDALLLRIIWAPLPFLMPDGTEFEGETGG